MTRRQDLTHPWPTGSTRLVVLLGWPARYSLSPAIHNAAFAAQDLDIAYLVAPVREGELPTAVRGLRAIGVLGANVTVPHKRDVVELCDRITDEAALIGAVNTLVWTEEGLLGDNSDAVGLLEAWRGQEVASGGDEVVVLGTGGAARAVAVASGRLGAKLTVIGRRKEEASQLAAISSQAGAVATAVVDLADDDQVKAAVADAQMVVNATPLGMAGESLVEAFHQLEVGQVAYDLIYEPATTPFLRDARERGVRHHHGLAMLVGQAATSYQRWTGVQAPLEVMHDAALAALRARASTVEADEG